MSLSDSSFVESQDLSNDIATAERIRTVCEEVSLPPLPTGHRFLSVWRDGTLSVYRRLFLLAVTANIAVIIAMIARVVGTPGSFTYAEATTAVAANLFVATVMRHEHAVNLLFRLATHLPHSTPLWIRRHAAKIYCHGGLHSGCGTSAVLWYIFFTILIARQSDFPHGKLFHAVLGTIALMLTLLVLQVSISIFPQVRQRRHNFWELTHRYTAWVAIVVIWAQIFLITSIISNKQERNYFIILIKTPATWFLATITLFVIHPWLYLRRVPIMSEPLSSHATRLWVEGVQLQGFLGIRLSNNPLLDNHGFATIPNEDGQSGFSVLVSRAGDFTSDIIDNPPTHLWKRGAHTIGVARVALLFRPLVLVATGSGIGPCLSFLQARPQWPVHVVWSTRDPLATYGAKVMKSVLRADSKAMIINTSVTGRPDLLRIVYSMYKLTGSEAVVMISNPAATKEVVHGLEMRSVPAFGVIFDS